MDKEIELSGADAALVKSNALNLPRLERERPSKLDAFVYKPPFHPAVLLHEHFHCEDMCQWSSRSLASKMPDYWSENIKTICIAMLTDVMQWCQEQTVPLKNLQKMATLEIFFHTLKYFINSKHADARKTIDFFEEQVLRYTVQHPPKSLEILDIPFGYSLLTLFSDLFLPHLALLRATTADNHIVYLEVADPLLFVKKANKKK